MLHFNLVQRPVKSMYPLPCRLAATEIRTPCQTDQRHKIIHSPMKSNIKKRSTTVLLQIFIPAAVPAFYEYGRCLPSARPQPSFTSATLLEAGDLFISRQIVTLRGSLRHGAK